MSRPATSRLKVNPPLGLRPSLENHRIGDLNVDPTYQRSIEAGTSQTLIRRIAMFWDWALFQPLAVSRRADGTLWVVDGQHRLAGARLRNDIYDLPCVVTAYDSMADEAASFVAMNQQRRPLNALDLFRAALAAGDDEATEVQALIVAAGLTLATHTNHTAWKPCMVSNIGGIRGAFRQHGKAAALAGLQALATAWPGAVLQYAGSIFIPIVRCFATLLPESGFDAELFVEIIGGATQKEWLAEIRLEQASSSVSLTEAGERVLMRAYREAVAAFEEEE